MVPLTASLSHLVPIPVPYTVQKSQAGRLWCVYSPGATMGSHGYYFSPLLGTSLTLLWSPCSPKACSLSLSFTCLQKHFSQHLIPTPPLFSGCHHPEMYLSCAFLQSAAVLGHNGLFPSISAHGLLPPTAFPQPLLLQCHCSCLTHCPHPILRATACLGSDPALQQLH